MPSSHWSAIISHSGTSIRRHSTPPICREHRVILLVYSGGGSAQVTFAGRLGIEGAVSTAASTIRGCPCPGGFVLPPTPARVTVATVAGQYDLSNRPARYRLSANVGPALMRHGGAAYGRYGSPTSWGGTAGLELAASIAKHLHVVATVSGVGYSFNLASPPEHGPQLDATALLGVRWHSGP